ncbi:hypothetical protein [Kibdelosporangium aridum]|uniref:hypothetical protein n=1 Tax=Kibdelosporangium aridum TaxID=2030 RepID=UPI0005618D90|nr:hypothetical protein [Kibdelosporangium aridum]
MSGDHDLAGVAFRDRWKANWWRWALIAVSLAMAVLSWREPVVAVFAAVPVLIWWSGPQAAKQGAVVLAITAWILMPRVLGLSGNWVPSVYEVCLFLPIITALVFGFARGKGCLSAAGLSAFAVVGLLTAGYTMVMHSEGDTGNEGVRPGPSGLEIAEGEKECGSGGCTQALRVTGDHAAERMREHLSSLGFDRRPGSSGLCRVHGLLIPYKVCAGVKEISPTTAEVSWSI